MKPGARGFNLTNDKRLNAEIKTIKPYNKNDFGANKRESIIKDFHKLKSTQASFKYMFVTEKKTFEIIQKKYNESLEGINLKLLY